MCKKYCKCKKDYSWNPSTGACKNGKYLDSIASNSVLVCDETIYIIDIVSTLWQILFQQMSQALCQQVFIKNYHIKWIATFCI